MATVQDLYRDLKYYIGEEADIFYLLNSAIRVVAKRLYWLDSDVVTDIMSVPIAASVTLTASDIAFVASDPPTITGVAGAFVTTGFAAGMPITTDDASNPGPFQIDSVAAGTITLHESDAITAVSAGTSTTITSSAAYGFLPDDFWGLKTDPYLDGKTVPLIPLPGQDVALQYSSASLPLYFKIRGSKVYVIPETSESFTIKADYFVKPDTMESLTDTIPWNDQFNDAIWELTRRFFRNGSIIDAEFEALCQRIIDPLVPKRDRKAPGRVKTGIDYNLFL